MYENGVLCYTLAVTGLTLGMRVMSNFLIKQTGCSSLLLNCNNGDFIHNIELTFNLGGKYIRSAGVFAKVIANMKGAVFVKFHKTRKVIKVNPFCMTTFGSLIRTKIRRLALRKAGYTRHRGWRPHVRGYAMNPVDHPHGGRTKSGLKVSFCGKDTKGKKTKTKISNYEV